MAEIRDWEDTLYNIPPVTDEESGTQTAPMTAESEYADEVYDDNEVKENDRNGMPPALETLMDANAVETDQYGNEYSVTQQRRHSSHRLGRYIGTITALAVFSSGGLLTAGIIARHNRATEEGRPYPYTVSSVMDDIHDLFPTKS